MERNLHVVLEKIRLLSTKITFREHTFELRRRFNPHHPEDQVAAEKAMFDLQQHQDFTVLKSLYSHTREELLSLDNLSKEDREIFQGLDRCIGDDLEREMLSD